MKQSNKVRLSMRCFVTIVVAGCGAITSRNSTQSQTAPPGSEKTAKTKTLELGAKTLQSTAPLKGFEVLANAFIGFGVWHILDSILSHWILGIHRIRIDAQNVLFWDLLWFFVFGVAFVLIGRFVRKRTGPIIGSGLRSRAVAMLLALAVVLAGPVAAVPPANVATVMVFF